MDFFLIFGSEKKLTQYTIWSLKERSLLVIDIMSGQTTSIFKIDDKKISRPFVLNQNLFIIEKNSIIKLG